MKRNAIAGFAIGLLIAASAVVLADLSDSSQGGGGSFTAGGDLSGTSSSQTVIGINGTALSGLSTGLLKITTGTGVPSTATAGTDYLTPSSPIAASQLPNPSASTLGAVESAASQSHKWINAISTSGVPGLTQPAAADLSDGTSGPAGGTIALNTANSFTATLATGLTTTPTGTINYTVTGKLCSLSAFAAITGTSNATGMTLTGVPAACQPAHAKFVSVALEDASVVFANYYAQIGTGGTITFYACGVAAAPGAVGCGAANFSSSGTKGLPAGASMIYPLD